MADVKFCGLTRTTDVEEAVRLGARYVGVILASGPRLLRPDQAGRLLAAVPGDVARVGVFGAADPVLIAEQAREAGVAVVQLHGDPDAGAVAAVRARFEGTVWAVARVAGDVLPEGMDGLLREADAIVLDARSDKGLGGTGMTLPWARLAAQLGRLRSRGTALVLAGGLTPSNVAEAINAIDPDIVDVSSGVESAPGIKDHSLMGAFAGAARAQRGAA